MAIIAELNEMLQEFIPGQVGRYDDGFNINCVGDTLQQLNIPTILFEAGHFPNDYKPYVIGKISKGSKKVRLNEKIRWSKKI